MKRIPAALLFLILASSFSGGPLLAQETDVEKGEIEGVPFRIQIPSEWNHGLVMYAHGYRPRGGAWFPLNDANSAVFLKRGFALAESGYARQGWAVEEAVRDTEALRRYFMDKHPDTGEVYVTGHSMGGHITLALHAFCGVPIGEPVAGEQKSHIQISPNPCRAMRVSRTAASTISFSAP